MPLTNKGKKIMTAMKEEYGKKKGEQVFYASKNNGNIYGVEKASKGKAIKVKSYKGGGMDAGNKSNQAQSAAMGKAGVDNQVASATDYSGLGNRSNSTKDALKAQNKGARGAISPSTTTGNKVASAAMNFVLNLKLQLPLLILVEEIIILKLILILLHLLNQLMQI